MFLTIDNLPKSCKAITLLEKSSLPTLLINYWVANLNTHMPAKQLSKLNLKADSFPETIRKRKKVLVPWPFKSDLQPKCPLTWSGDRSGNRVNASVILLSMFCCWLLRDYNGSLCARAYEWFVRVSIPGWGVWYTYMRISLVTYKVGLAHRWEVWFGWWVRRIWIDECARRSLVWLMGEKKFGLANGWE